MALAEVCAAIAAVAGRPGSGIVSAHTQPPEVLGRYPASWVNPVQGTITRTADEAMWLHEIQLIVYAGPRAANLPVEFADLAPLVASVERAFWDAYVAGEFDRAIHGLTVARYQIGLRDFGGKPQHSVTFTLNVKEHTP